MSGCVPDISGGHAAEQYLPENLRSLCESKGISQAALAKAMSERGWKWHQQTAYKVQNGKRGISFGEATDLARILAVSTDRLTWSGPEANETALVDSAIAMLRRSWHEMADATTGLERARGWAERTIAQRKDSKYQRVRDTCAELGAELGDHTLETAVAEGIYRYQNPDEEP